MELTTTTSSVTTTAPDTTTTSPVTTLPSTTTTPVATTTTALGGGAPAATTSTTPGGAGPTTTTRWRHADARTSGDRWRRQRIVWDVASNRAGVHAGSRGGHGGAPCGRCALVRRSSTPGGLSTDERNRNDPVGTTGAIVATPRDAVCETRRPQQHPGPSVGGPPRHHELRERAGQRCDQDVQRTTPAGNRTASTPDRSRRPTAHPGRRNATVCGATRWLTWTEPRPHRGLPRRSARCPATSPMIWPVAVRERGVAAAMRCERHVLRTVSLLVAAGVLVGCGEDGRMFRRPASRPRRLRRARWPARPRPIPTPRSTASSRTATLTAPPARPVRRASYDSFSASLRSAGPPRPTWS